MLVDESVQLRAKTQFDRESRQAKAQVEAEDVVERDAEKLAVTEDGVCVEVDTDVKERARSSTASLVLARCDNVGGTSRKLSTAGVWVGGLRPTRVDTFTGAGGDGRGGGQESEKDSGDAHFAELYQMYDFLDVLERDEEAKVAAGRKGGWGRKGLGLEVYIRPSGTDVTHYSSVNVS